ncbi:MAG: hypothetical protein K0U72_07200 [Gammaproteobacteria bacterium]|nr:hypothetical protein [Gammaproteobacteria bacterium]
MILDKDPVEHEFEDAHNIHQLKGALVLKYQPDDIEDTIYFMRYRGYFMVHGQGAIAKEIVFSSSEKACEIADLRSLPDEEENGLRRPCGTSSLAFGERGQIFPRYSIEAKRSSTRKIEVRHSNCAVTGPYSP